MPKIPLGNDAGLGEARYNQTVQTPVLGRPVQQEVGPGLQVNRLDVVQKQAAPLSQIKPVLPSAGEFEPIQQGLDKLTLHAERIAAVRQEEVRKVNEAAEKTSLLVSMGDQKAAYQKDTLDIINNPDLPDEEKAKALQRREDDFRATITATDPKYQPVVASEVMGTIGSVKAKAQEAFLKNKQDDIRADLETRANQLTLDAASSGDLDGALLHFDALHGAFKDAGLTDAHFIASRQKFEQSILQNDIMGNLKVVDAKAGAPALEAVTSLLSKLDEKDGQGAPVNWIRLDPATRNADIAAVLQKKNQIAADMLTQADKEQSRLSDFIRFGIDAVERSLKEGLPPNSKTIIGIFSAIQELGQADDPKKKLQSLTFMNQYQDAVKKYNVDYWQNMKREDPLGFGTGVSSLTFSNFATPDALRTTFTERYKVGKSEQEKQNLGYVPLLTKQDVGMVIDAVAKDPANGIRLIDTLGAMLGPDAVNSLTFMAGQVAGNKAVEAPIISQIIGHIAKGDRETATALADGIQALKNDSVKKPVEADFQSNFNSYVGSAFSEAGDVARQHYEAFKAVYMSMATRSGIADGTMKDKLATKALNAIVGPVIKFNGGKVLLPDNKTEDEFLDYINSISPQTVQAWGGIHGMTNENAARYIKDDVQFKKVSPTAYVLTASGRRVLQGDNKTEFRIDTRQPLIKPIEQPVYDQEQILLP